jgi:hypothetical protein
MRTSKSSTIATILLMHALIVYRAEGRINREMMKKNKDQLYLEWPSRFRNTIIINSPFAFADTFGMIVDDVRMY